MFHRVISHFTHAQQRDWTAEVGPEDYAYENKASELTVRALWMSYGLENRLTNPRDLLRHVRAAMVGDYGKADERAQRIMLRYQSSIGTEGESIVVIPHRQKSHSASEIVSSKFLGQLPVLQMQLQTLIARDFSNRQPART